MKRKLRKYARGFARYMRRTWRNKLDAIALICCAIILAWVSPEDITASIFLTAIAIPLFFAKGNLVYGKES